MAPLKVFLKKLVDTTDCRIGRVFAVLIQVVIVISLVGFSVGLGLISVPAAEGVGK